MIDAEMQSSQQVERIRGDSSRVSTLSVGLRFL